MKHPIETAVERAITAMHDGLGGSVTVEDMARAAMFSKFHFARVFQRTTGLSPGRFLSALRLQKAKDLLISTSMHVADISVRVGYNSVGTFGNRFTRSVGLSPTAYRRLGGFVPEILPAALSLGGHGGATVGGHIWPPPTSPSGFIFVGLFPGPLPEGRPVRCTVLDRPGEFVLNEVPAGTWFLLAHWVSASNLKDAAGLFYGDEHGLAIGSYGPIRVHGNNVIRCPDLNLGRIRPLDPPVLLALLDVRQAAAVICDAAEYAA